MKISFVFRNQFFLSGVVFAALLIWWWPAGHQKSVKLLRSPYGFTKTVQNIKKAITSNNFKVVRQKAGRNSHTLYFCNFNIAYAAIKKDSRAGVMLPCKIKIIKNRNRVFVATVNVDAYIRQTGIRIGSLCNKIRRSIDSIVEEATI